MPAHSRPVGFERPASLPPLEHKSGGDKGGRNTALKEKVLRLEDELAAAVSRAEVAEKKLAQAEAAAAAGGGSTAGVAAAGSGGAPADDQKQRLMVRNWRLSSQLAEAKRRSSPRPQPAPPPHNWQDPTAGLADWLAGGGKDTICSVAAKAAATTTRLCGHAQPAPHVLAAASKAAAAAAEKEASPVDSIKAALDSAAVHVGAIPISTRYHTCLHLLAHLLSNLAQPPRSVFSRPHQPRTLPTVSPQISPTRMHGSGGVVLSGRNSAPSAPPPRSLRCEYCIFRFPL